MSNPMGEANDGALRLDFDRRLPASAADAADAADEISKRANKQNVLLIRNRCRMCRGISNLLVSLHPLRHRMCSNVGFALSLGLQFRAQSTRAAHIAADEINGRQLVALPGGLWVLPASNRSAGGFRAFVENIPEIANPMSRPRKGH